VLAVESRLKFAESARPCRQSLIDLFSQACRILSHASLAFNRSVVRSKRKSRRQILHVGEATRERDCMGGL